MRFRVQGRRHSKARRKKEGERMPLKKPVAPCSMAMRAAHNSMLPPYSIWCLRTVSKGYQPTMAAAKRACLIKNLQGLERGLTAQFRAVAANNCMPRATGIARTVVQYPRYSDKTPCCWTVLVMLTESSHISPVID